MNNEPNASYGQMNNYGNDSYSSNYGGNYGGNYSNNYSNKQPLDEEGGGRILHITENEIGEHRTDTCGKRPPKRADTKAGKKHEAVTQIEISSRRGRGDLNGKSGGADERGEQSCAREVEQSFTVQTNHFFPLYDKTFLNCTQYSTKCAKNQGGRYKFSHFTHNKSKENARKARKNERTGILPRHLQEQ